MEGKSFILVSVPQAQNGSEFARLKQACCQAQNLCIAYKLQLPALRMGTLDALISLCDDLDRVDHSIEGTCRRLVSLRNAINHEDLQHNDNDQNLMVSNMSLDTYCVKFRWDEKRYPTRTPLASVVSILNSATQKIDEQCRTKQADWNTMISALTAANRKQTGSLRDKDIDSSLVKQSDIVDTDYMQTLFVLVTGGQQKQFLEQYETLAAMVVPRSAKVITSEGDYTLYRVVLFRRAADDFRTACRENRFMVRDFVDDNGDNKKATKTLERNVEKQAKTLRRWTAAQFSEVFTAWTHLKAVRLFVESVLRYGPPANYETMILVPNKNDVKKLRSALATLYAGLTSTSMLENDDDDDGVVPGATNTSFYAYVSVDFDIDLGVSDAVM
mmetsp:Transcript_17528/g.30656  ORF Transcript_17528/g.30656 Transcript_17528/m.30656 type:complete len:386 (+) Transcript_17528:16-1173(+)